MVSRPLRAGRATTWTSSARMVAPRAMAWRVEASAPRARVSACAVTASWTQAALALNAAEGKVRPRPVDQVREDLLHDRVAAVVALGLYQLEGAVGEHRVIPVGGEQFAPWAAAFGLSRLTRRTISWPPVRWARLEANAVCTSAISASEIHSPICSSS
jgi:hypothetical protein